MAEETPRDRIFALIAAASEGNVAAVISHIDGGADIHRDDDAALRGAVYLGHRAVVETLLERGANVHADNEGPLCAAIQLQNHDMIDLLLKKGANIQAVLDNKKDELDTESLNIIDSIQSRGAKAAAEKGLEVLREKARKSGALLKPKS